jgi:hypothetical protein
MARAAGDKVKFKMGYFLQALIGKQQTFKTNISPFQNVRIVTLQQDIAIIPITNELCEEIGVNSEIEKFYKLSPEIEEWAQQISAAGFVAYVEAEFFGGTGSQSAIAWNAGSRVINPIHGENAINQILKHLEVNRENAHDEFEAIGLGKHRNTNEWKRKTLN